MPLNMMSSGAVRAGACKVICDRKGGKESQNSKDNNKLLFFIL